MLAEASHPQTESPKWKLAIPPCRGIYSFGPCWLFEDLSRSGSLREAEVAKCQFNSLQPVGSLRGRKTIISEEPSLQRHSPRSRFSDTCAICIPWATIQQTLHRNRNLITDELGHLPGILAFDTREQAAQIFDRLLAGFTARKQRAKTFRRGKKKVNTRFISSNHSIT